jgi:hypothetical protein
LVTNSIAATPFLHSAGSVTAPPSLHFIGRRIDRRAAIISAGQQIPSPRCNLFIVPANLIARCNLFSGLANLIAAPLSFLWAGESHRRATIVSAGQRIPSPRRNHFSGPANPIARRILFSGPANLIPAPQSF